MSKKERPMYARNFSYLKNRLNITRQQIKEATGIPVSTWGSYEEGRGFPHHEKLVAICDLLKYWDIYAILTRDISQERVDIEKREAIRGLEKLKAFLEELKQ